MSFGQSEVCTFKRLAASGNVGDAGKAIDILGYTISSGSTAAAPSFINGQSGGSSNTLGWVDTATTASAEKSISLAYPVRIPAGCYVSFDANTTAMSVFYRQVMGQ
jgi:hypothetical protein